MLTYDENGGKLHSPFDFHLQTVENVKPGAYSIDLAFSYFDGATWQSQTKQVDFKVENFLERNATMIGRLAIVATVVSTASSVYSMKDYFTGISAKFKKIKR